MTVDKKSWELAGQFLEDVQDTQFVTYQPRVHKQGQLAEAIQKAIEDWLSENTIPF